MKLVLSAPDGMNLKFELQDLETPVVRMLSIDEIKITALKEMCASYQAVINHPNNMDALNTIGCQLFELLNHHPDLVNQWRNSVGNQQLEIRTAPVSNVLQHVLLNLPWEVMACNQQFLAADIVLYEVVRRVGEPKLAASSNRYKDMTLAFMAADPDFNSGLNYENEERAILQATCKASNLNLWVEESGNLRSLIQRITESGHCDVAHISCHGVYKEELRSFALLLEDDLCRPQSVTASDFHGLAQHIQCLFLSACHSAEIADAPAFAMELAKTGIANVIGWDGSVSDADATIFAAKVYFYLLQQMSVPFACAAARQHLLQEHLRTGKHPHWHLGRVYLAPNGGWPLIDSSQRASPKRLGKSFHELLDRKKNVVPVASKETFVGRRKQTKEALRIFTEKSASGVLLTGIGGTGKSSLAARIVHRMEPQYKAAIIYKDYSEASILGELKQFVRGGSSNEDFQRYMSDIQQRSELFSDNLVNILEEYLNDNPIILVVDDLEQNALEYLNAESATNGKVGVKLQYQNALRGVIEAFVRADTKSRLILTSRHSFYLSDQRGGDWTEVLQEIRVPDMSPLEQEKHWLALLQSGATTAVRDVERDRVLLQGIWAVCRGNPGLQDVLYQPLLKGEYEVLQTALNRLQAYHAGQSAAPNLVTADVDKYLQRIALEAYHDALTDTEKQCLRVLSLFDFAIPQQLIIQAAPKFGIEDAQSALQRLDNFGLLTHWRGEGLEGHFSCYGLARKIVAPLSKSDRHFIASVSVPLLWHIWFADFLHKYHVPSTNSLRESVEIIIGENFPAGYYGELPLQTRREQECLACLNRFCIENSLANWDELGFDASVFINFLEFSVAMNFFDKLRLTAAAIDGFSNSQWKMFYETLNDEREAFKGLAQKQPQDIIYLLLDRFASRPSLFAEGYQIFFGQLSDDDRKLMDSLSIQNEEDRYLFAIKWAKTKLQKAKAYRNYAKFLAYKKQDYEQAEKMFQLALNTDPQNADGLWDYARFLMQQEQGYVQAEQMFQQALNADPQNADGLGSYAKFLMQRKQDYVQAEKMFQLALNADPQNAACLVSYATFLRQQKQDYVQADAMYQMALNADLQNADGLGDYAVFLVQQKQDYEQAEKMFQRALKANPHHGNNLMNYAFFLRDQKKDYVQADLIYQRAVRIYPREANALGIYASFLCNNRKNYVQAEEVFQRALEAEPCHANNLGNYAKLLFVTNQKAKALQYLKKAESQPYLEPELQLELAFYRYAHCPPYVLTPLKQLLRSGLCSIGWDLTDNVQRARADGHPHPELIAIIAQVISGEQDIATLDQYPKWTETA